MSEVVLLAFLIPSMVVMHAWLCVGRYRANLAAARANCAEAVADLSAAIGEPDKCLLVAVLDVTLVPLFSEEFHAASRRVDAIPSQCAVGDCDAGQAAYQRGRDAYDAWKKAVFDLLDIYMILVAVVGLGGSLNPVGRVRDQVVALTGQLPQRTMTA